MNRLSSAKEFALSPFSFGKILRAIGLRRRPPDCKTDRKQGKNLYYKTRANKKGVSCRKRHKTPKKSYVVFRFWGTLRALARGGSLPFFVRVFCMVHLPNLGVSIIDTPKFGSSSLFCV